MVAHPSSLHRPPRRLPYLRPPKQCGDAILPLRPCKRHWVCLNSFCAFDHYSQVKQTDLLPEGNDRKRRCYSWTGDGCRKVTERYHRRVVRPSLMDVVR